MSLDRFDLTQPLGLLALLALVPLVLAWRWAALRRRSADEAYGGASQLRTGRGASWRRISMVLTVGAIVLLAIAVARPRWGEASTDVERRGVDVAIALDVSGSMLATDVAPTRAEAAAAGLRELLAHLRGDRVSLSIFAGSAFERSPVTLDLDTVSQLVTRAQGEQPLVRPGSDLGLAIEQALASLTIPDAADTQIILLISDGEDLRDRLDVALSTAEDRGIRIDVVPVGTGAEVTLDDGQISRADRETLAAIASRTGGEVRDLDRIAGLAVEYRQLALTLFEATMEDAPAERFQWFLGAALALLIVRTLMPRAGEHQPLRIGRLPLGTRDRLASTRHGLAAGGLLAALLIAGCTGTSTFAHVEEGNAAFAAGDFDGAQVAYTNAGEQDPSSAAIQYNRANALHELRRFEEAKTLYEEALPLAMETLLANRLRYGAASTEFRRDALEEARDRFIAVLRSDPDDLDAAANLELVLIRLNPPPDPPPPPPADADGEGQDGEPQGDAPPGDGTQQPSGEPGQGNRQPGDTGSGSGAGGTPPAGGGTSPSDDAPVGSGFRTIEEALEALREAQAALGEEISREEALLLLELAAEVNALRPLRGDPLSGPVAR